MNLLEMDFATYAELRGYCLQDLYNYIHKPVHEPILDLRMKLAGNLGLIEHEYEVAKSLFRCIDMTPRERAAAKLLAVISNHRAITWRRESNPPLGLKQLSPVEESNAEALAQQTRDAVRNYACFLPEREAAVLIERWDRVQTQNVVVNVPEAKSIGKNERKQLWQSKLESMAADLIREGKKSQATKGKLARRLAQEIGENEATIERNTRKNW